MRVVLGVLHVGCASPNKLNSKTIIISLSFHHHFIIISPSFHHHFTIISPSFHHHFIIYFIIISSSFYHHSIISLQPITVVASVTSPRNPQTPNPEPAHMKTASSSGLGALRMEKHQTTTSAVLL